MIPLVASSSLFMPSGGFANRYFRLLKKRKNVMRNRLPVSMIPPFCKSCVTKVTSMQPTNFTANACMVMRRMVSSSTNERRKNILILPVMFRSNMKRSGTMSMTQVKSTQRNSATRLLAMRKHLMVWKSSSTTSASNLALLVTNWDSSYHNRY